MNTLSYIFYLLDAIGPALADAVSGPDVVCILSEFVHHGFLGGGQFDVTQVERSRFITAGQLIAANRVEAAKQPSCTDVHKPLVCRPSIH